MRPMRQVWVIVKDFKYLLELIWQNKDNDYLITEDHDRRNDLGKYTVYNAKTRKQSISILKKVEIKKEIDCTINVSYDKIMNILEKEICITFNSKIVKLDCSSCYISIEMQFDYWVKFELEDQLSAYLQFYINRVKKRFQKITVFESEDTPFSV